MIKSIIADLGYMLANAREFGLKTIPEDIEYLIDNIKEKRYRTHE